MPKIYVQQKNLTLDVDYGANLMKSLVAAQVPVASSCLGDGICGKCRMTVLGQISGEIPPASDLEKETLLRNKAELTERLSCQLQVNGDLTVTTNYW